MTAFRPCSKSTNVPFGQSRWRSCSRVTRSPGRSSSSTSTFSDWSCRPTTTPALRSSPDFGSSSKLLNRYRPARWRGNLCHRHTQSGHLFEGARHPSTRARTAVSRPLTASLQATSPVTFRRAGYDPQVIEVAGPSAQRARTSANPEVRACCVVLSVDVLSDCSWSRGLSSDFRPLGPPPAPTRRPSRERFGCCRDNRRRSCWSNGRARLDMHEGRPNVEAYINQGDRIVYLMRQGVTLQGALKGPRSPRLRAGRHHLA